MSASPNGRRLSILVVDDDLDAADTLALLLRLHGHDARAVYSGEQAVAILDEWHPDAAVLDIVMVGVSGFELAAQMRKDATRPIFLVAATGIGTDMEVARLKGGAFDYVFVKPVDPDALVRLLSTQAACLSDAAARPTEGLAAVRPVTPVPHPAS